MRKQCQTCLALKPETDFPWKRKGHRRPHCRTCYAVRERQRYRLRTEGAARRKTGAIALQGRSALPKRSRYIITYAQNATPVHGAFWQALLRCAAHYNAELVVVPGRYRNPTSLWTEHNEDDEWWSSDVAPHLFKGRKNLGGIVVHGDISVQPTAVRPLSGMEVYVGKDSAIFGHPKVALETVASGRRAYPRLMMTTGACTIPNYTDSKAGRKAEKHHVIGATLVEVDRAEGLFFPRQLNARSDGTFHDLEWSFSPDGVEEAPRPRAISYGDIHVERRDDRVYDATFLAPDSILATLRPERQFLHDLLDFDARGKYRRDDFWDRLDRLGTRRDIVEDGVRRTVEFADTIAAGADETYVPASNHDDHFDDWLLRADPRKDPVNARFFHEMWAALLRRYEETGRRTPALEMAYEMMGEGRVTFLERDDVLEVDGVYYQFHGDKGTNGARPGAGTYAKLGVKTVTGHTHSPQIRDGNYTGGVSGLLDHGYNHLPSSWMHAHVLQYATGKRTLLFVVNGRWRL